MKQISFLKNQSGALTIVTLMLLGSLFLIMTGVAGVKLLTAAQEAKRSNEAYNYLLAMEDFGIQLNRARSLGRGNVDCAIPIPAPPGGCPGTTVRRTFNTLVPSTVCPGGGTANQYTLCVPDADGDGVAEFSDFRVTIDGFLYALDDVIGVARTDVGNESGVTVVAPNPFVEPAGAAIEQTSGAVLLPRNNQDSWYLPITVAAWPGNNEIFTPNCTGYPVASNATYTSYWVGCNSCSDPMIDCWQIAMCPPSGTAALPACGVGQHSRQGLMIYFENDIR